MLVCSSCTSLAGDGLTIHSCPFQLLPGLKALKYSKPISSLNLMLELRNLNLKPRLICGYLGLRFAVTGDCLGNPLAKTIFFGEGNAATLVFRNAGIFCKETQAILGQNFGVIIDASPTPTHGHVPNQVRDNLFSQSPYQPKGSAKAFLVT